MSKILDTDLVSSIFDTMSAKPTFPTSQAGSSFEEKSVWIQLVSVMLSMLLYIGIAWRMTASGDTEISDFGIPLIAAAIFVIVLNAVGHAIAAIVSRQDIQDERDRLFELRAGSRASWVVSVFVFAAIGALILEVDPVWIGHLLLCSLFASELVKNTLCLLYYRRGGIAGG